MVTKPLPLLPGHASKWLRYVIAFSATLAVGLAPLLGSVRIPGFSPIVSLFPVNVRTSMVPFAAFVMAIPAVLVQYFAGERIRFFKPRLVLVLSAALFGLIMMLFLQYNEYVVPVDTLGKGGTISYIVGTRMKPSCECAKKHLDIVPCIGNAISAAPVEVDDCFEPPDLRHRKGLLSITYIVMSACFGSLIGVLVLKEEGEASTPPRRRPSPRKRKR